MKGIKPGWAVKALLVALLLCSFSVAAAATNHSVGGAFGWNLSSDLQEWASQATFHVGDSLVFTYAQVHEVLEVNETEYYMCHTVNPLDGGTVIPLMEEGDRYFFMCGRLGHCAKGLKLHVHVLPQLKTDSNATSSPDQPSPTASAPHATLLETLAMLCLGGVCTLGIIVHPVYNSIRVLTHGWDENRDRFSKIVIPLLTSTVWLYYEILRAHAWIMLGFKILTVTLEICNLVIVVMHVQPTKRLFNCVCAALFNVSIPLHLLLSTSASVVGSCAVVLNLLLFAWPIYTMKQVIVHKKCSEDDIGVGDSLIFLLNGLLWNLYGYMMRDFYIAIPNVVGVCVAIAQIVVMKLYQVDSTSLQEPLIQAHDEPHPEDEAVPSQEQI